MIRLNYFLTVLLCYGVMNSNAQVKGRGQGPGTPGRANAMYSPEGVLDHLYDAYGNTYRLADLCLRTFTSVNPKTGAGTASVQPQLSITFTTCNSGYFTLYFEPGCGMEGTSQAEADRRNVLCQVFSDISQFISSPLSSNGGRVNILVRDITNMGLNSPFTSTVLGMGSGFYNLPVAQNVGGIAVNLIWQTILSGTDAYTNVVNPLTFPIAGGGAFYHGMIGINFTNPNLNWHAQVASSPAAGEYDLYSIALHEATHALGFSSLIGQNGQSKFGTGLSYYSRYDSYLKTQNGTALLSQITNSCSNGLYNWTWNASLSTGVLQPGYTSPNACIPDVTTCSTAINFALGATVQPVYTPNCFDSENSLSHFEDQCAPLTPGNNLYFVMSNITLPGSSKRFFKPQEREALCAIGYNCGTSFNTYTYTGGPCVGTQVAGINDGINAGGYYTFLGGVNSAIAITGILGNDHFTSNVGNTFKCLEVVLGAGSISASSGTSSNYTPSAQGLHLLRYIPVDGATGKEGNITYVYVFAQSNSCIPNSCNLVTNGGFEQGFLCGWMDTQTTINCWYPVFNYPIYMVRGCSDSTFRIPTCQGGFSSPSSDTWNNGASGNNAFLFLANSVWGDAIVSPMSSSMMPATTYIISFWAKVANATGPTDVNVVFAGGTAQLPYTSGNFIPAALPPSLTQLTTTLVPNNNQWHYYSVPVSFTGPSPLTYLYLFSAGWLNTGPLAAAYRAVYIDDVSITAAGGLATFVPPSISACQNHALTNLNDYTSLPGGTFTGTGVSYNSGSGHYEFNSGANLPIGSYPVVFSYTSNGCSNAVTQAVNITCLSAGAGSQLICKGQTTTLTAGCAVTYSWSNGLTSSVIAVSPTVTSSYTVTGIDTANACRDSLVIQVAVSACLGLEPMAADMHVKIYPNPVSDNLYVETESKVRLIVQDALGRSLGEETFQKGKHSLDMSGYSPGLYFVRAVDDTHSQELKVIKTN